MEGRTGIYERTDNCTCLHEPNVISFGSITKRKTVTTIIFLSNWKEMQIYFFPSVREKSSKTLPIQESSKKKDPKRISRKIFQEKGEKSNFQNGTTAFGNGFRKQPLCPHKRLSDSFSLRTYTQRDLFEILLNQNEIRLYLPFSDWFGTKRTSVWF